MTSSSVRDGSEAERLPAYFTCGSRGRGLYSGVMWQGLFALWLAGVSGGIHDRGVDLYKHQKYADAISALEEAVKTETPGTSEYRESVLMIGQSYFMLSQAPKAIPWLEKLPGVNEANYMLGYAYLQTAQPDRSEAAFARLYGLNPASAAGHLLAGQMMLKKEFRDEAVTEVKKALALDPKLPQAYFLLGEAAIGRGELDEAITLLTKELEIDPNFSMAWSRSPRRLRRPASLTRWSGPERRSPVSM